NVGCEADAQQVERVDFAVGVSEADEINGTRAAGYHSVEGSLRAVAGEIAKEGIAGAERKKAQRDTFGREAIRENAVQNVVSGAVAANGEEAAVALIVSLARKQHGVTGAGGSDDVDVQTPLTQACEGRAGQLGRAATTRGGIHDGEKTIHRDDGP